MPCGSEIFKSHAAATSLDVDLANDIVTLAVASGEAGPFQQVLGEYKMVSNPPEAFIVLRSVKLQHFLHAGCLYSMTMRHDMTYRDVVTSGLLGAMSLLSTQCVLCRNATTPAEISCMSADATGDLTVIIPQAPDATKPVYSAILANSPNLDLLNATLYEALQQSEYSLANLQ